VIGIFSLRNSIQQNSAADSGRDVPARKKPDEGKNGFLCMKLIFFFVQVLETLSTVD
jgi:hypothetical protein